MNKGIILVLILGLVILALAAVILLIPKEKPGTSDNPPMQGQEGLIINSPRSGSDVASPLEITGVTAGWNGFEGQVGTVRLIDYKGNALATGILQATSDWMKPPVTFKAVLAFDTKTPGPATLVFRNENPSGLPQYDKTFSMAVRIKESNTMVVKAFFAKDEITGSTCNVVFPVERTIAKTSATARAALEELLKGPTASEESQKLFTSINSGVKINSLKIENGTAFADFDERLQEGVGGSCKVATIRSQIVNTLKQFSTVKSVVISIDGRTEDILQP